MQNNFKTLFQLLSNANDPVALAKQLFKDVKEFQPVLDALQGKSDKEAWSYMQNVIKTQGIDVQKVISNLQTAGGFSMQFISGIFKQLNKLGLKL